MSVTFGLACWFSGWIVGFGLGVWVHRRLVLRKLAELQAERDEKTPRTLAGTFLS